MLLFRLPLEFLLSCSCVIRRLVFHLFHSLSGFSWAVLLWPPFSDTPFHLHWLVHLVSNPSSLWTPSIPTFYLHVFPRQMNLSISLLSLQLLPDPIVVRFVPPPVFLRSKWRKWKSLWLIEEQGSWTCFSSCIPSGWSYSAAHTFSCLLKISLFHMSLEYSLYCIWTMCSLVSFWRPIWLDLLCKCNELCLKYSLETTKRGWTCMSFMSLTR